jgi:hypothetical protein
MRILYRLMSGTALLALPYFSTAQVTKASDDYAQTQVNAAPITIRVLDNDSAANGRRLKVDYIPLVNHGTARITADSSAILFTPEPDFKGIALVNYTIADGDGTFDCGLVVIDVAATPTPTSQEMNLFTRKGRPVRFTVPTGFLNASTLQGATVEKVRNLEGVYEFTPNPTLIGTFDLLFNKSDNGVTKDFSVHIEVLNALPLPVYLKDHYIATPVNELVTINVLEGIKTHPRSVIAGVEPIPGGGCFIEPVDRSNPRSGRFYVYPPSNFKGSIQFGYKVRYENDDVEEATVHLTVSNFYPAASEFKIMALARQSNQTLSYKVPAEFSQDSFSIPSATTDNGGLIQYINGQLKYTAPQSEVLTDAFSLKYCVRGSSSDCQAVDVKVKLIKGDSLNPCVNGNCVWPGDANQDGRVDIADIFPIGDNIGQYGSKRIMTSEDWYPQQADNWRTLSNIADPKYADTNGDGIVSIADTAAIIKYYGNSSSLYPEITGEESKIQTFLTTGVSSVRAGDMIEILIFLGSSDYPALDTRGLSFSVDYSAQKVKDQSVTVDFGKFNWLSRYDAFLTLSKIPQSGTVDAAIVRSRDRGASGHGEVGKIRAIVIEDIAGLHQGDQPSVRFKLRDARLIDGKGRSIAVQGSEIVLPLEVVDKNTPVKDTDVKMYPNPTNDFAEFYLNGANTIQSIRILDLRGREVKRVQVNGKHAMINMDNLSNGLYLAEVMTEKGRVVKKLQVIK